jgi:uncharacterized protein YjiS (DUF1127 family)
MNAPVARNHFEFSLGNVSYIGPAYEDPQTTEFKPSAHGAGGWLGKLVTAVAEWHQRQAVLREMQTMSDRELSDIGLSRADLARVFDPSFAADYSRNRNYIAY